MLQHGADYAERRRGGQDENNRRRINAHQGALRGSRLEAHSTYDGPPTFARAQSKKGAMCDAKTRRRGRPAHLRSPEDSPLRDGNRDRVIGLLTERCASRQICTAYSSLCTDKQSNILSHIV